MPNDTENIQDILEKLQYLQSHFDFFQSEQQQTNIDMKEATKWLHILVSAFDIFLMQAGFALLEVGTVRAKNAKSILFKNTLDAAVSMLVWWSFGFGLAGGGASGQQGRNFCSVARENAVSFVHSYVFAGTTATIVSGGVAERMSFSSYLLFSIGMVGIVYPVLIFWGWSSDGWMLKMGYLDFAGSGLIHLCGGTAALVGATLIGPRLGRFKQSEGMVEIIELKGHSPILSNMGTFILLFGWLSFNGSSTLSGDIDDLMVASTAVVNTLLSVTSCALTSFIYTCWPYPKGRPHVHNLDQLNNSMLAGAVAITAGCAFVDGWAAVIIGVIAFFVYNSFSKISVGLHVDDPLEASAVHGACGLWGVLAVGVFGNPDMTGGEPGLLMGGNGYLLGIQLLVAAVIIAWTTTISICLLKLLNVIPGCQIRASKDSELLGLDFAYHDGFAYPDFNKDAIEHFNEIKAAERRAKAKRERFDVKRKKVKDLKKKVISEKQSGQVVVDHIAGLSQKAVASAAACALSISQQDSLEGITDVEKPYLSLMSSRMSSRTTAAPTERLASSRKTSSVPTERDFFGPTET